MELLEPGQSFAGRYRVERFLAQGGFGAVFAAEQVATELRVAIKVLWPHILGSKEAVEKFELEARVAARVNSDHIVKVLDAGFDEATGLPFLVMELLEGESLEQLVGQRGPLSPVETYRYLTQVALGLDRAHGYVDKEGTLKPIVHRDLKPENLFLCRRPGAEPVIKILDFGIAKVLSQTSHVSREVKGTPLYMAHEQASGQPVSPRTDIWALGLIAFYLLTGRLYWRAAANDGGVTALFGEILTLPIEPPSARLRELGVPPPWPPGFDAWFLRCVHREPAARFASAGEAVRALGAVLGTSSAVWSSPASGDVDALSSTLASPGLASVQGVTAAAMSVSGVGAPASTARKRGPGLLIAGTLLLLALAGGAALALRGRFSSAPTEATSAISEAAPAARAPAAAAEPVVPTPVTSGAGAASSAAPSAAPAVVRSPAAAPIESAAPPAVVTRVAPSHRATEHARAHPPEPQPAPRPAPGPAPAAKPQVDIYGER